MTKRMLLLAAWFTCILGATCLAAEREEGYIPIFNGKDLTGWEGEEGFWSVEDGAITGATTPENPVQHSTYLRWQDGKVADFELRFSYRIPAGNSGVQFRSRPLEKWDVAGYQADFDAPNQWTGCLYDCNSHRADPDRVIAPPGSEGRDRRRWQANPLGHCRPGQAVRAHQQRRLERVPRHRPRAPDHAQDQRARHVAGDRPREGQGRPKRDPRHPAPRRRADEGAGEEPSPQAILSL